MSTRFYFGGKDLAPAVVAPDSGWDDSTHALPAGTLKTYPEGHTASGDWIQTFGLKSSATTPYDILGQQFISQPLTVADTLSGTFSCAINIWDNTGGGLDEMLQVIIRIINNNGTVVRGIAYAGQAATAVVSTLNDPAEEVGSSFTSVRCLVDVALTSVAYQVGDRIVVEVGLRSTAATTSGTPAGKMNLHDDDRYPEFWDYALHNNSGSGAGYWYNRSWIEFSDDLFAVPGVEEFKFTDEGVLLNTDPEFPFVDITSIDGVDAPGVRLTTHDREGLHGSYVSSEFETSRTITVEGNIYCTPSQVDSYLDTLKKNFAPSGSDRKFYFGTDAGVRFCWGKSQGLRYTKDSFRRLGMIPFQVQIVCQDPRQYGDMVTVAATSSTSTSLTDLPIEGDRDTPALVVFKGGSTITVNEPSFLLENRFGRFTIAPDASLALAGVRTVAILDTDKRLFFGYNGSLRSLNPSIFGSWVNLAAEGNRFQFKHTSGPAQNLAIMYRPAWR